MDPGGVRTNVWREANLLIKAVVNVFYAPAEGECISECAPRRPENSLAGLRRGGALGHGWGPSEGRGAGSPAGA